VNAGASGLGCQWLVIDDGKLQTFETDGEDEEVWGKDALCGAGSWRWMSASGCSGAHIYAHPSDNITGREGPNSGVLTEETTGNSA